MAHRSPAVAGRFYPDNPALLAREVATFLRSDRTPGRAVGVVVPHAGYVYSGAVAGATFGRVTPPARALVMAPNHSGRGAIQALFPGSGFSLPGGDVPIDGALQRALLGSTGVTEDAAAHAFELAIEVELPLLRALNSQIGIAALCLSRLSLAACQRLGQDVAQALTEHGLVQDTLLVASTDMSHYVPADMARALDQLAIERILALDPQGLYETVIREDISMCGFVPTTVMLFAARELGARSAELVRYTNSGERSGDYERVVGYAGMLIT